MLFLKILVVILTFASAIFWILSARVSYKNINPKILRDPFKNEIGKIPNPDELCNALSQQSKWSSYAAICAAIAAGISAIVLAISI